MKIMFTLRAKDSFATRILSLSARPKQPIYLWPGKVPFATVARQMSDIINSANVSEIFIFQIGYILLKHLYAIHYSKVYI